jgi:pSer/pThr/pTyr-binding forkhead associated (FHA) protein
MKETWVCLIKIKSEGGFRSHVVDKSSFTIGRTQEADLPIIDVSVSRLHLSVQVKSEGVTIVDKKSANGTILNGKPMTHGQSYPILSGDTVKLGNSNDEFSFQAIPKPFELSSLEEQKNAMMASMSALPKEIDDRARRVIDEELNQTKQELEHLRASSKLEVERARTTAKLEVEEAQSKAQLEIEEFKAQASAELQARKAALDEELANQRQVASSFVEAERVRARKGADHLAAEALVKIQKDYEKASLSIEKQMKNSHTKSLEIIAEADRKANAMVTEARDEAARVRLKAADEVRVVQQELLEKTTQAETALQERMQRELGVKREELANQLRFETERERDRTTREQVSQRESLQTQMVALDERRKTLQNDVERLDRERSKADMDYEGLQGELVVAKRLISETEELQKRRLRVELELRELERTRESGAAVIEKQMTEARQSALLDFEAKKRELENEMAKRRLASLAEIESLVKAEEKRYEQTRKMRAIEVTEKLHERLIVKLASWAADPDAAAARLKPEIEAAVTQVLVSGSSTIQAVTGTVEAAPMMARQEVRDKRMRKKLMFVAVASIAGIAVFHQELLTLIKESQKDSHANRLIELRKIQSIYSPAQTDDFRDSYGDNVLYMRGYFDAKADPEYLEKWTLRLNDLAFLRSMGLNEENIVQFVSKETNLVQRLGALRSSIDAVYLGEGIERMRKAEAEDVAEIEKAIKGTANLKKIRAVEREFLRTWMAKSSK